MGYEPPEWQGRGAAGRRDDWPTTGRNSPPRSHRRVPGDDYSTTAEQRRLADQDETRQRELDLEQERHDRLQALRPVEPIIHVFEREGHRSALQIVRDVAIILVCIALLLLAGETIRLGGVPLWLPRS